MCSRHRTYRPARATHDESAGVRTYSGPVSPVRAENSVSHPNRHVASGDPEFVAPTGVRARMDHHRQGSSLRRSDINDLNHALRRMLWNRGGYVRPIEL